MSHLIPHAEHENKVVQLAATALSCRCERWERRGEYYPTVGLQRPSSEASFSSSSLSLWLWRALASSIFGGPPRTGRDRYADKLRLRCLRASLRNPKVLLPLLLLLLLKVHWKGTDWRPRRKAPPPSLSLSLSIRTSSFTLRDPVVVVEQLALALPVQSFPFRCRRRCLAAVLFDSRPSVCPSAPALLQFFLITYVYTQWYSAQSTDGGWSARKSKKPYRGVISTAHCTHYSSNLPIVFQRLVRRFSPPPAPPFFSIAFVVLFHLKSSSQPDNSSSSNCTSGVNSPADLFLWRF